MPVRIPSQARTYEIDPGAALPELAGLPDRAEAGETGTRTLVARYFDTDDLRLAARGITLCQLRDGGWHLGLPDGERPALDAPSGGEVVPARLASLVAAAARGRPLRRVATLKIRRTVVPLLGPDGEVLAEIVDDEVRGRRKGGPAERWREIALGAGPPALLDAAGERLREGGARPVPTTSKLGRLLTGDRPAPAGPGYETAGDVIVAYVRAQLETILDYDPRVRLAEYDSVHRMRVAVRRIRSILRSAAPLLGSKRTRALEAELKWLAGKLGEVRDLEVLRERFAGRFAEIGEPAPSWLAGLDAKERRAYKRLRRTLTGDRYFALLDALDAFVTDPPFTKRASRTAGTAVPRLVARAWRRVARRHAELAYAENPDEARHRTRKAAKRARYTAEAARPVLGERALALALQAERVQETLGAYQDSVIAREHLAELDASGDEAPTLDVLIGLESRAADQALEDAREVWEQAARPELVRALTE